MKRVFYLFIIVVIYTQAFSMPGEVNNFQSKIDRKLLETAYVGSQTYKYLVGGLYNKNNITGAVFYIDEKRNVMRILCVNSDKIISDHSTTKTCAKKEYEKNKWHLFNQENGNMLCDNIITFLNNRTWVDNEQHRFVLSTNEPGYIIMDGEREKTLYLLNIARPSLRFQTTDRYLSEINENGGITIEEMTGIHTAWREVPFEPEYVTCYIGE